MNSRASRYPTVFGLKLPPIGPEPDIDRGCFGFPKPASCPVADAIKAAGLHRGHWPSSFAADREHGCGNALAANGWPATPNRSIAPTWPP
jgi:hypothetical protein